MKTTRRRRWAAVGRKQDSGIVVVIREPCPSPDATPPDGQTFSPFPFLQPAFVTAADSKSETERERARGKVDVNSFHWLASKRPGRRLMALGGCGGTLWRLLIAQLLFWDAAIVTRIGKNLRSNISLQLRWLCGSVGNRYISRFDQLSAEDYRRHTSTTASVPSTVYSRMRTRHQCNRLKNGSDERARIVQVKDSSCKITRTRISRYCIRLLSNECTSGLRSIVYMFTWDIVLDIVSLYCTLCDKNHVNIQQPFVVCDCDFDRDCFSSRQCVVCSYTM